MVRANRYFLTNKIYHNTHRCHNKDFCLKFNKDKENWLHWLFEAKKRFGLSVLNYVVTSNHIHLLVWAETTTVISDSMHLIAGATGQAFNNRKKQSCMAHIDLNMVRAGLVEHPSQYSFGGYHKIENPNQNSELLIMSN
jgi:putative transposase